MQALLMITYKSMEKARRNETLSFRVTDKFYQRLWDIGKSERRILSEVSLALLERGLAAYERDGSLFEVEPTVDAVVTEEANREAVDEKEEVGRQRTRSKK
jgi:hypothetical protein